MNKYFNRNDNKWYPVGIVTDAQAVTAADGRAEVQSVMRIHNRVLYDLIRGGEARGCSVVDYPRRKYCDAPGSCKYEGSVYLFNTIALLGEPHSPGTYVRPVTAADIGTIIVLPPPSPPSTATP